MMGYVSMIKKRKKLLTVSSWILFIVLLFPPQRYLNRDFNRGSYSGIVTRFNPIILWSKPKTTVFYGAERHLLHIGLDSYALFILYLFIISITSIRYLILGLKEDDSEEE
jgi:hypothetical protein